MAAHNMSITNDGIARHEIEETLHLELIPGTEVMTDVGSVHFKHAGHKVLVPQPSNDPSDPLNWNRKWKSFAMGGMAIASFTQIFGPLSAAPQVPYYMEEFDASLPQVINFIGVAILVLGFSNLIWVPFARVFGRRPMLLLTNLITIASSIWRAEAKTYNSFLGACILSGIGTGPSETLGAMLVTDVMFLHERGRYMGLYQWSLWSGVMLGPVVAGVTAQRYGWRSFWWICSALSCFAVLYQVFFLPETKWKRHEVQNGAEEVYHTPATDLEAAEKANETNTEILSETEITVSLSGSPSRRQFLPFTGFDKDEPFLRSIILPFQFFTFPIAQWASFVFSWCASCFLVANITQSQALAGPPWNLTPSSVGYTNCALFAGTSFALLTAGPLSDWISMRATVKNRGIREPEMRLPALIPFACCTLIGSLIVCIGYQHGWSWEVIVIIGYTLLGIQVASLAAIATTYAIDSYKPAAGEFLVSATINKNLWGYGLTKFLNIWIQKDGYVTPIMTNAGLCLFFVSLGLPLYFWGKKVRSWTKNSSVHAAG